jgi:hypothetical protein
MILSFDIHLDVTPEALENVFQRAEDTRSFLIRYFSHQPGVTNVSLVAKNT